MLIIWGSWVMRQEFMSYLIIFFSKIDLYLKLF